MISGPRNLSTAIMYSFNNRKDTLGVDEPFYAHYLKLNTDVIHPGRTDVLASQSTDANQVIEDLNRMADEIQILFIKNMAHHLSEVNKQWILELKNIFLIRHPKQLINSFTKVVDNPTIKDIGLKDEFEIYQYLKREGKKPIVVDSSDILKEPKRILTKLSEALDIKFMEEMLHWKAGPKEIDGVWAPYWYKNVHLSTGFSLQKSSSEILPKKHNELLKEALPYYNELYKEAIK